MSFEYYGAFKALNFLRDNGAPQDQAEAVSEAIIRHADLGKTGTLTSLGLLIQLSTVFGKYHIFLCVHRLELRGQEAMHAVSYVPSRMPISCQSICLAFCLRPSDLGLSHSGLCSKTHEAGFGASTFIQTTCNVMMLFSQGIAKTPS